MPIKTERGGVRNFPKSVLEKPSSSLGLSGSKKNLTFRCQDRIWQSSGKWGHCRDRALEIKPHRLPASARLKDTQVHVPTSKYYCVNMWVICLFVCDAWILLQIQGVCGEGKKCQVRVIDSSQWKNRYIKDRTKTLELHVRTHHTHRDGFVIG